MEKDLFRSKRDLQLLAYLIVAVAVGVRHGRSSQRRRRDLVRDLARAALQRAH